MPPLPPQLMSLYILYIPPATAHVSMSPMNPSRHSSPPCAYYDPLTRLLPPYTTTYHPLTLLLPPAPAALAGRASEELAVLGGELRIAEITEIHAQRLSEAAELHTGSLLGRYEMGEAARRRLQTRFDEALLEIARLRDEIAARDERLQAAELDAKVAALTMGAAPSERDKTLVEAELELLEGAVRIRVRVRVKVRVSAPCVLRLVHSWVHYTGAGVTRGYAPLVRAESC